MTALRSILYLLAGPLIWCVWFVFVYGGLSVLCAARPEFAGSDTPGLINAVLGLGSLLFFLFLLYLFLWGWRSRSRFPSGRAQLLHWLGMAGSVLSAVALLVVALPISYLPPCL